MVQNQSATNSEHAVATQPVSQNATALKKKQEDVSTQVLDRVSEMEQAGALVLPKGYHAGNALKSAWLYLQTIEDRSHNKAIDTCTKASIANVLLEMYPYYCDALESLHRYEKLDSVTHQWWQVIERRFAQGDERDMKVLMANYFIACAQAKIGKGKLDEAERMLNQVEKNLPGKNSYEYLFLLFYRAKLRMLQGNYHEALDLNAERNV